MKILHIVPSYKPAYIYGGPIESVSKLCEGLVKAGHEVDVFTTTANGETELPVEEGKTIDVDGVNVTYFRRITKDHTHVSPDLWKHLYKNVQSYDIVNIQSWWSFLVIVAACICHAKGVRVVVSPRGMLSPYIFNSGNSKKKKLIHAVIGRWALSKTWFHATAEAEVAECREVIPGWKGFMIANNVTLPDIPIVKQEKEVFTLIFMSRVHQKKGIEILLNAVQGISFPVKLQIAGSGEADYTQKLKDLVKELGIEDKVEWLGWMDRDRKFKVLMEADLFVLASLNENFANVVLESLHMGTPVMVSKEVALSKFVADYKVGWVSSLATNDVTKKITEARNEKEKRHWIEENGREIIAKSFSEKVLIAQYVEQYKNVINYK
ncbi:glycosyltransferase [Pedobacter sp. MC2016-15]|uniref:XrtY-associated glycosyltransferase XYAG1 n=1 Tax=Pedobacter sp. MC2016-15 TaxID=2994473 RepID=UPI002245E8CC|nr:glycosyltransferase [Pedobacter sp. MC2016-15]MCX2481171.1 glycosyltransferase [Pedobacter sp. MC2016-15]